MVCKFVERSKQYGISKCCGNTKKELYDESIVLIKVGTFYNAYFKDAILLSYLFGYKIKKLDKNVNNCGFPVSTLNNVKYLLEQKKINYIIIDKAHNYEENEKENFYIKILKLS